MAKMFDWTVTRGGGAAGVLMVAGVLVNGREYRTNHLMPGVSEIRCADGRIVALRDGIELCELSLGAWAEREADYMGRPAC